MKPTILMYVKPGCPYCAGAEQLFTEKGYTYKTINYFELSQKELDALAKKTDDWRTAPMIFINKKFYGGFSELQALEESGELDKILTA